MVFKTAPMLYKFYLSFVIIISFFSFETRYISVVSEKISYTDIILIAFCFLLLPLFFKKTDTTTEVKQIINLFYFILCYSFLSTIWVSYEISYWYIAYQLILAALTITIPALLSKLTNDKHVDYAKFMSNLSLLLTIVFAYYITKTSGERLSGGLGGAAIVHSIIILPLAVHLNDLMSRKRIILSIIGLCMLTWALFLTESRAALLCLVLFVLLTAFRKLNIKRFIAVAFFSIGMYVFLLQQNLNFQRYSEGFDDSARTTIFKTGMAWWTHSVSSFMFGNGYGSIWTWYAFEQGVVPTWNYPFMNTAYGIVMFHAHSVFTQLFAETGVIGLLPFLVIIYLLLREFWRSNKTDNELRTNILGALICTLPTLHTDLFFFRNWKVSIIWLFFLFTALAYKNVKELKKAA